MLGRIGGLLHSVLIMWFSWKRITMLFSFVKEQTEENVNMLFVTNATRNIQKARRDQEVVFSVKMSWCRLVIMSYAIYSYVLMCGGVPEIIWVDPSGQNVPLGVLSVTGCLLWVISNWGHFVGTHVYCFWTWAYTWYICLYFGLPEAWNSTDDKKYKFFFETEEVSFLNS